MFVLFFSFEPETYAGDNVALMQCMMFTEKNQQKECLRKEFPFFLTTQDGLHPVFTELMEDKKCLEDKRCEEVRNQNDRRMFDRILGITQILSSQCLAGSDPSACINAIDARRCNKWLSEEPTSEEDAGLCFGLAAFLKKDLSVCRLAMGPSLNDAFNAGFDCEMTLIDLSADCLSCGEEIFKDDKKREQFYTFVALIRKDMSFCQKIQDTKTRNECWGSYGPEHRDVNACALMDPGVSRDNCYLVVAQDLFKEELCDNINDMKQRDRCYTSIVANKKVLNEHKNGK